MGFKTFLCLICQEQVTKPQSFAYKDGRACRKHQEAQQAHAQAEQKKQQDLNAHKNRKPAFSTGRLTQFDEQAVNLSGTLFGIRNPNTYCWHCSKDGIYENLIYLRILVNMSKAKLKGLTGINPFLADSPHFAMTREDLGDRIALKRFPLPEGFPEWKVRQIVTAKRDLVQIAQLLRLIVLCTDCAVDFEFDWKYDRVPIEKMDLQDLLLIGVAVEQPLNDIAMREILDKIFHKDELKGAPL